LEIGDATNEYRFNMRGAGYRQYTGDFLDINNTTALWHSDEEDTYNAHCLRFHYDDELAERITIQKALGLPIRVVKDT